MTETVTSQDECTVSGVVCVKFVCALVQHPSSFEHYCRHYCTGMGGFTLRRVDNEGTLLHIHIASAVIFTANWITCGEMRIDVCMSALGLGPTSVCALGQRRPQPRNHERRVSKMCRVGCAVTFLVVLAAPSEHAGCA